MTAHAELVSLINDIRLNYDRGQGTLGEVADRALEIMSRITSADVTVIEAGCAECRSGWDDEPLVTAHVFPDLASAKEWAGTLGWLADRNGYVAWTPHPQGGEHVVSSQGSLWILPEKVTPL